MKIWFDTEFIEDGRTIDLISIGLVREDGAELYLENVECDLRNANDWVRANVFPKLGPLVSPYRIARYAIAKEIHKFAGHAPEFWAYYAAYDWVSLCQLYGKMIDLPKGWPMFCRDLKHLAAGIKLPKQDPATEHHALNDARWTRDSYLWLTKAPTAPTSPSSTANVAPISSPFSVAKGYGTCPVCGQNVAYGAHGSSWRERSLDGNTCCGACGKITLSRDWKE